MSSSIQATELAALLEAVDLPQQLELRFLHWQRMAELQQQFLQALGEAKLQAARAELARAVAAEHWALARIKSALARDLELTLRGLRRRQRETTRYVQRLGRLARSAAKIRSGEDLPSSQLGPMSGAYTVFERLAPADVLIELSEQSVSDAGRSGAALARPGHPDQPCPAVPDQVQNVLSLITWLRRRRLVPRRGTLAYRWVIAAFARVASVAETEIQRLQTALEQLQRRTYDTWQPVVLAALPDNVDTKKLISLGTK